MMGDRQTALKFYHQADAVRKDPSDKDNAKRSYDLFSAACYADPTWWLAWYQHGNNHNDIKLHHAAVACWRRALACQIDSPTGRRCWPISAGVCRSWASSKSRTPP
jgi:tetratricopeptide (TPR) repeat protein